MAGEAITLKLGMSTTAMVLLSPQTANSFLFFTSIARPLGLWLGVSSTRRVTAGLAASISRISLEDSRFTYTFPAPSTAQNSGAGPSGNVATISLVVALIAVESLPVWFMAKTRLVLGS